jgi:hypothetical protein
LLTDGFFKRGYEDAETLPALGWNYQDDRVNGETAEEVRVSFSSLTDDYNAVWQYEGEEKGYARLQGGQRQSDQDNTSVYASNVVILKMSVAVIDDMGRREIDTISQGKGVLFRDGRRVPITWNKANRQAPLELLDEAGKRAALRSGPTWIEIVPLSTEI